MGMDGRVRVGVIAGDPLRSLGLETILADAAAVDPVPLTLDALFAGKDEDLAAALMDSACIDDLPGTLARLRREQPRLRVVIVGESLDPNHIQAVIGAGAKGYLPGTANEEEIRMAIEVVLDGSVWAPRKVLARLIEAGSAAQKVDAAEDPIFAMLTPRERDVLEHLLEGQGNRQIADAMGVDTVTVKAHLGRMLRKAGASNRVELTLRAMRERDNPNSGHAHVGNPR